MSSGYVGILSVELHFPEAGSLKGKRKFVKSAKAQLQNRFGVSVAEVDHHDLWQRARLTMSCVTREYREAERLAAVVAEAAGSTSLGALAERSLGYAYLQGRNAAEALPHLERSLEIAEGIGGSYEIALTLKALADAGAPDADEHRTRSQAIFSGLGIVAVAEPPLP